MDVANSEKALLAGKAVAGQKALDSAQTALEELLQSVQSKVSSEISIGVVLRLIRCLSYQREEHKSLTEEEAELQRALQSAQSKLEVRRSRDPPIHVG